MHFIEPAHNVIAPGPEHRRLVRVLFFRLNAEAGRRSTVPCSLVSVKPSPGLCFLPCENSRTDAAALPVRVYAAQDAPSTPDNCRRALNDVP